jgi:hypothetical protein
VGEGGVEKAVGVHPYRQWGGAYIADDSGGKNRPRGRGGQKLVTPPHRTARV